MKDYTLSDMPPINRRLRMIVNEYGGNVRGFARAIGIEQSSTLNRLFNKDKNGVFPPPSVEIVLRTAEYVGCTTDWIIRGIGNEPRLATTVNNITINKSGNTNVKNGNVIGDNNSNINFSVGQTR